MDTFSELGPKTIVHPCRDENAGNMGTSPAPQLTTETFR